MLELPDKLLAYLAVLYGDEAERIKAELETHAREARLEPWRHSRPGWHRQMRVYTIRPEGVVHDVSLTPLQNLTRHLPHVRRLHCNAMHILPFWESPMTDMGYDVSDYLHIRRELGSGEDLAQFKAAADRAGIHIIIDAVLNHTSDKGTWFRKAQQGDGYYRSYFIHSKATPVFIAKYVQDDVVVAEYEVAGQRLTVDVAFPELTGAVPHWCLGRDGYWYYHSYYPQEIDLDWSNPEVFIEYGRILMHWGSRGFSFRLDAIPFVGKPAYKRINTVDPTTHLIILALKCVCQAVHPNSILLAETYENLPVVLSYFGSAAREEVDLCYNFHLCTQLWISIMQRDAQYAWAILERERALPPGAQWLNFLRNHDELSLAHLPEGVTRDMLERLLGFGKVFREGHGVSGRTFSLLGCSRGRLTMAYFLLASLPGCTMVYFGDEVGLKNARINDLPRGQRHDTRNINRGILHARDLATPRARETLAFFADLLGTRRAMDDFFASPIERMTEHREIFLARYRSGHRELMICINLTPWNKLVLLDLERFMTVLTVNRADLFPQRLSLGPYGGIWMASG